MDSSKRSRLMHACNFGVCRARMCMRRDNSEMWPCFFALNVRMYRDTHKVTLRLDSKRFISEMLASDRSKLYDIPNLNPFFSLLRFGDCRMGCFF